MLRIRHLAALAAIVMLTIAGSASAAADRERDEYKRYAEIRDQVKACVLDQTYHQLGSEKRRTCKRYRKLYQLYGESSSFHLHCLTRTCPPTPLEEPSARAPIPPGSKIFVP